MANGKKINTYAEVDALNDDSTFVVLQKIGENRKVRQLTKEKFTEQFIEAQSYTRTELQALVTASSLIVGKQYICTNATSATLTLILTAVAVNKFDCKVSEPLYNNDVILYDFTSNVITWRWDSVNDISAGEDWRNSNDIQIGTGCSKIKIGVDCSVTIGNNSNNINIGNYCGATLFAGSENVNIDNGCSFLNSSHTTTFCNITNGASVICDNIVSFIDFKSSVNLPTILNKSLVYNNAGFVLNGEGDSYFQYINGGILTTTLLEAI